MTALGIHDDKTRSGFGHVIGWREFSDHDFDSCCSVATRTACSIASATVSMSTPSMRDRSWFLVATLIQQKSRTFLGLLVMMFSSRAMSNSFYSSDISPGEVCPLEFGFGKVRIRKIRVTQVSCAEIRPA